MTTSLIACNVALLLIACVVAIAAKWLKQPYSVGLVLVGLVVALTNLVPHIGISHDLTFTFILPPLLFHGAMHLDLGALRKNWRSISMLAIPGVICSTLLIGYLIHIFIGIDLMYALLFGALITPTDPVSVLAILGKVNAPKRLQTILEGESLFNDGTGVVVFTLLLGIISGGETFNFGHSFLEFLKVTGGGTLIGIILGGITFKLFKYIDDRDIEIALTVVLTFGTPLIAEFFHFSGIIAVVVAGLIIGNYGRVFCMTDEVRESLDNFWEVIEFIINSLLFLAIGIELQVIDKAGFINLFIPISITILIVLFSRAIVVYPIVWIKGFISDNDIPLKWSHVIFWAGLKGSISIALVVGLPRDFMYREYFLTVAFAIVVFTLIVQGLTMKPLVKKLGLADHNE